MMVKTTTAVGLLLLWCAALLADAQPGGAVACSNPDITTLPSKADLRGDTGCTSLDGVETYTDYGDGEVKTLTYEINGNSVPTNAHIYNSFEAGFSAAQDGIIEGWGCSTPSDFYDTEGGLDLGLAESKVRKLCYNSVAYSFPNVQSDNSYRGCIGPCGGHTNDYHFHGKYNCLYEQTGAHSTAIGDVGPYKMYGKWEDFANKKLPLLDACGAHIGKNPDSPSTDVYHYHAQDRGPYGVACYGNGTHLVIVQQCRDLYPKCNNGQAETFTDMPQPDGTLKTFEYDRDCPCFDANGLNTGTITERAIIAAPSVLSYDAKDWTCGDGVSCLQTVEKTLGFTDYVGCTSTDCKTSTTTSTATPSSSPPPPASTSGSWSKTRTIKSLLAAAGATVAALFV